MAVSRSDRNRSQKDAPAEKTMWEALEDLQAQLTVLKGRPKSRLALLPDVPVGCIVMWDGEPDTVPEKWHLCDGTNGTPDLREKYLKCTSPGENPGTTGGSLTHVHRGVEGTMVAADESAGTPAGTNANTGGAISGISDAHTTTAVQSGAGTSVHTGPNQHTVTGSFAVHSHTFTGTPLADHSHQLDGDTEEINHEPPFYKIAYIMRIAL